MINYNYCLNNIYWDMETETAFPPKAVEKTSQVIEFLSKEITNLLVSKDTIEMIDYLTENNKSLTPIQKRQVILLNRAYNRASKIPVDLQTKYEGLKIKAQSVWVEAKEKNDYSLFAPYFKELIFYNKKFIKLLEPKVHPYDILLEQGEFGMTVEKLDKFFDVLKKELIPFAKATIEKLESINTDFLFKSIPLERQKAFSNYLARYIGFDLNKGLIKESEHPFCMGIEPNNVRFTTHYYGNNFISSIYSVLHEAGHGIYEQNQDSELEGTMLQGGASMGVHESQSRTFENLFGRNYYFLKGLYPNLQEIFPEIKEVSVEAFYKGVNKPENSLIRIEADELTYSLHIMLRYEIEKMIFEDKIEVDELPKIWNSKMKEYFGLDVPNDSKGILQDVHWAGGMFGYFPSYSLGNAYANQIIEEMKKEIKLDEFLEKGEFGPINYWLREKIHRKGMLLDPDDLIKSICKEELNPYLYINYLKEKFRKIIEMNTDVSN
ncbi:MAG: carboxypeptidase M32 [Fusobacteriaceae bacterium]|nr:carboxypeptidase M32 [Fusobacteriaceae bacterium]